MSPDARATWRSVLGWTLLVACAVSWLLAAGTASSRGSLGIPGLALALNGLATLCAALHLLRGADRGAEADRLAADLRAIRERERFLEERTAGLQAQVELLSALREVSRALTGETRFEPVATEIFNIVEGLLGPEAIGLYLPETDQSLRLAALRAGGQTRFEAGGETPAAQGLLDPVVAAAAWAARRLHREGPTLAVPLAAGEAEMGVLAVRLPAPGEGVEGAERMLRDLAKPVAIALQHPNLRSAAVTDALTGLYTKRYLLERAPLLLGQLKARGDRLALLMTDLDHFKRINDTYGHPAGDKVLKEVARRVAGAIRGSDTAYRFGGEEMACLLPGATGPVAMRVAQRIRREVAAAAVALDARQGVPVTISIGVAAMTPEMTSWEALLSAADQALYQAKASGRDRVVLFKERR